MDSTIMISIIWNKAVLNRAYSLTKQRWQTKNTQDTHPKKKYPPFTPEKLQEDTMSLSWHFKSDHTFFLRHMTQAKNETVTYFMCLGGVSMFVDNCVLTFVAFLG